MKLPTINKMSDLEKLVNELGFLPFFANSVEGYSIEECVSRKCWYSSEGWPVWEWKGPVIQKLGCAYGKFFAKKAGFISREWFPDFANMRRDGYDFDARYDDGLARHSDKEVFDILEQRGSLLSGELKRAGGFCGKDGKKGFDGIITRLQMMGYVVTTDFEYRKDKQGNRCGWGIARYELPERFFGDDLKSRVYSASPEQSREKILAFLSDTLKNAPKDALVKLITAK